MTASDVDAIKFSQTLRGYKVSEVDWVLERLGQEIDQLRGQITAVRAAYGVECRDEFETEIDDDPDDAPEDAAHQGVAPDGRDDR